MRWGPWRGSTAWHCKSAVFALPRPRPRKTAGDQRPGRVGMSEHRVKLAVLGAILLALAPRAARATQKFGPIQVSGNLQTANIVRTPDQSTYEYIMNRNTAHVRLDYDWLQSGKFYNKYDIPFLESSHLSVVWRGVYDSIYDTTPGFIQKEDNHGRAYGGPNGSLVDVFDFAKL